MTLLSKSQMTTKATSRKQESMVAAYLGWDVVSGSGARDFHPGDIKSDDWLGECKTHMKPVDWLSFNLRVYDKIVNEAMSQMKKPIYFVDDGTQTVKGTAVLFSLKYLSSKDFIYHGTHSTVVSKERQSNIRIKGHLTYDYLIIQRWYSGEDIIVMSLDNFKRYLEGDFHE